MSSPLSFSVADYPHLSKLINGQDVTLRIKGRVGVKILGGQGEYIGFMPEMIDYEEDRKPSVSEILLASIDASMNRSAQPIP